MTKTDLISAVAEKTGMTKKETARAVNAFLEVISNAAIKGEDVRIPGFGTFTVKQRAARQGTDLRTGERITIPARKVVAFKPGAELKRAANNVMRV